MKLILRYVWRYKRYLLLSVLGVVGFVLIQMGVPTLLKIIINDAIIGEQPDILWKIALLMMVIILVGAAGEVCMSFANSRIATNVIMDIRNDLFIKTQSFSHHEFNQFSVSSLVTSTTSDAYQIMIFVQSMLRSILITPVMTVSGFVLIANTNKRMFGVVAAATPALLLFMYLISRVSRPFSQKQQSTLDKINRIMREGLTGLRVIRAFRNEEFQSERFEGVNQEYCGVSKTVFRIMSIAQPGFYLLFNAMIVLVIWLGSQAIGTGMMDVGTLNASIEYIFHILFSFLMLAVLFIMYPRASVSAGRIQRILENVPGIDENFEYGRQDGLEEKRGTICFEHVTFHYPDGEEAVLEDVSFTVEAGQTVAFIGSTGSGKSTLIQLIPRLYDVSQGRILVEGVDVRDYNIHALRDKLGYILQKSQLFTGSIEENLRIGKPDATARDLERAVEIAQAADFIAQKDEGFQTFIAEGGANLSGGQRQRLSIARAIIKDPEIYIFDDSFSALDYATDLKLRTRLREEIKDATVLIVAQRIGTIRHADKIIVLNEGRIVAEGTHEYLLKHSGIYYDIALSQLSEEALR